MGNQFMRKTIVILVGFLFPGGLAQSAQFQAEGSFSTALFMPGEPQITRKLAFRVTVGGCNWKIETERVRDPLDEFDVRVESGATNTGRIYTVSYGRKKGETVWKPFAGGVRPGPIPHIVQEPGVTLLWVAYASSCYFQKNRTNGEPLFAPSNPDLYNTNYHVALRRRL